MDVVGLYKIKFTVFGKEAIGKFTVVRKMAGPAIIGMNTIAPMDLALNTKTNRVHLANAVILTPQTGRIP